MCEKKVRSQDRLAGLSDPLKFLFYITFLLSSYPLEKTVCISGRIFIPLISHLTAKEANFPPPKHLTFHQGNGYLKMDEEKQVMLKFLGE